MLQWSSEIRLQRRENTLYNRYNISADILSGLFLVLVKKLIDCPIRTLEANISKYFHFRRDLKVPD